MVNLQTHATYGGYRMLAVTGNRDTHSETRALQTLRELRVDGLVIGSGNLPTEDFSDIAQAIPTVVVGREAPGSAADVVRVDAIGQAQAAAELLRKHGHRHIGFISVPHSLSARPRQNALRSVLREAGIELTEAQGSYDVPEARKAIQEIFRATPRPTAIVSLSADGALAALDEAHNFNLRIPHDISVLCLDEPLELPVPGVTISAIPYCAEELATQVWELLSERINNPDLPQREKLVFGTPVTGTTLGRAHAPG